MISGAHAILYSKDAEADRAFFRDVLELPNVDAGDGWLIFALPPSEVAVHPAEENGTHELYLTCDDVKAVIKKLRARKIACSATRELEWGILTQITLPGGGKLGLYQPKHPMATTTRR
jgi:catechol 2,3-dioxygenase-like lactoylglutathione lyase family enzyme